MGPLLDQARALIAGESLEDGGFLAGALYTALLPRQVRAALGAHYTPPALATRLLDLAESSGVDWAETRALDPACGGGAFLAPLALRILGAEGVRQASAEERLRVLERSIAGIEIDPFAAWMSRVLLRLAAYPLLVEAGRDLAPVVSEGNTLERVHADARRFDLIIGNPPYGRVRLSADERSRFRRSLHGHANLYGLFLDSALRMLRPDGGVAFLTPTSFLGGLYFSRLRRLLSRQAPLRRIDFVETRTNVFDDVLQETCLALFAPDRGPTPCAGRGHAASVGSLHVGQRGVRVEEIGRVRVQADDGEPWLLPRTRRQADLVRGAGRLVGRLPDIGYQISTGPLVWNRHKHQIRTRPGPNTFPLVWAEAVRPEGFSFDYRTRDHAFVELEPGQEHLLLREPAVLIQRTTPKEQPRRIVATVIPQRFLDEHGAVVVGRRRGRTEAVVGAGPGAWPAQGVAGRWYGENSREPIRDETLRSMVDLGVVVTRAGLPTTSPRPRYALQRDFADLFDPHLGGEQLDAAIAAWRRRHLSVAALARLALRGQAASSGEDAPLVRLPTGETRRLAPGPSNWLAKAVVEVFAPRFLEDPAVVIVSESARKLVVRDDELCRALGIDLDVRATLPDLVLADVGLRQPLLVFVECVHSDGPVTARRREELEVLATKAGWSPSDCAYLTVFRDRVDSPFRSMAASLAWGSFVWFVSEPDGLVVLRHDGPEELRSLGWWHCGR